MRMVVFALWEIRTHVTKSDQHGFEQTSCPISPRHLQKSSPSQTPLKWSCSPTVILRRNRPSNNWLHKKISGDPRTLWMKIMFSENYPNNLKKDAVKCMWGKRVAHPPSLPTSSSSSNFPPPTPLPSLPPSLPPHPPLALPPSPPLPPRPPPRLTLPPLPPSLVFLSWEHCFAASVPLCIVLS